MHARTTAVLAGLLLTIGVAAYAKRPPLDGRPHPPPPPPPPPHEEVVADPPPAQAADAETTLRAAIAPNGDELRLVTVSGGKKPGATLQVGKAAATKLYAGDAVGTVEVGHGKIVVALSVIDSKAPFRVWVDGAKQPLQIARPNKRADFPFAIAMTPTTDGFTILFQEIEAANTNEAHTYMVTLDQDGKLAGKAREVQIPWWLGGVAWNGKGYHLALFYAGDANGIRLSMVSTDEQCNPQGHPDWASKPGLVSDVHLVANGGTIMAYYRGAMGDRLHARDVTKIGNWGTEPPAAKDLGALAGTAAIAISAKGQPVRVKAALK